MFSGIRKRMTYGNVAVTLALVFAMTGGAYAASKGIIITSTKQISKNVLKELKKPGPAGPEGKAGAPGANGKDGAPGGQGEKGALGPEGKQGPSGTTGPEGSPWTVGSKLPSGKSETGTWAYRGSKENGAVGSASISFTLPVKPTPPAIEFVYAGKTGTHCVGTAELPTAPAGYLCVYDAFEEKPFAKPGSAEFIGSNNGETFSGTGAGSEGALLNFETVNIGTSVLPYAVAEGTWIVTAK
ncbi:MAG TPA: hypothetical protein VN345_05120 [Blastocatellia bacterium]|jgi:hypothetical protein|nr:hypothetical protein [Blastocatellia bacterium]